MLDINEKHLDKIPLKDLLNLKQELIDSDLPFKVDLVNFNSLNENIKQQVQKDMIKVV